MRLNGQVIVELIVDFLSLVYICHIFILQFLFLNGCQYVYLIDS